MRTLLFIFSLLLVLTGCFRPVTPQKTQELKPPVEVEIPQSFVTDGVLHVKVSLKPLVNLKADQVAVDLIGVNHGQEEVKKSLTLKSLVIDEIVKANVPLVTDFEMDAGSFDEYKVVCRWSAGGVEPVAQNPAPITEPPVSEIPGKFELLGQVLVRSECKNSGEICERTYSIQAKLKNATANTISQISLALEIKFVPTGDATSPPSALEFSPLNADEQEVKLEGLTLSSNETRPIEVKIPEALVEIPDGRFVPRIRLYSYK